MEDKLTKFLRSLKWFLQTKFRNQCEAAIEIFLMMIFGHMFGIFTPSQLAQTLKIDKNKIYRELKKWSVYQMRRIFCEFGCKEAIKEIKRIEQMSPATRSRYRITLTIDDTVIDRLGRLIKMTYNWYSGRWKKTVKGQNIIGIAITIGDRIIPLGVRLVAKQGRGNTSKPEIFEQMLGEIVEIFRKEGIELDQFPISFDSWYGSHQLVELLSGQFHFDQIIIHAKSNYVFTIDGVKSKLSVHKQHIELLQDQWGCSNTPVARRAAQSPTFGKAILLFFKKQNQTQCLMCFGRKLRACEILSIWNKHHSIEYFWRCLKSDFQYYRMRFQDKQGAFLNLAIKLMAYLAFNSLSSKTNMTFRQMCIYVQQHFDVCSFFNEHFHLARAYNPATSG